MRKKFMVAEQLSVSYGGFFSAVYMGSQ